jgi:hypothetical protein
MKIDDLVRRAEELIQIGIQVLSTRRANSSFGFPTVETSSFEGFRAGTLSFFKLCYGTDHPYFEKFNSKVTTPVPDDVESGLGILKAVKNELEGGWVITTKGLVSAEIFSDFIEMSEHLLEMGYKDPAAVIIGSVLEEHLRQLCQKNSIDTHKMNGNKSVPKKSDLLNAELANSQVYNKLDQKNVTAWLDLRNKAAHGHYSEYNKEQVELMCQAVTEFMARNSV